MKRTLLFIIIILLIPMIALAETDFFSDSAREESAQQLYNSIRFTELETLVEAYIDSERPGQEDSAYAILDILESGKEAIDAIAENIDSFDNSRSFTLDGVTSLEDGYCIVPCYDANYWLHAIVGFIADDWVFFDRIAISADGELVYEADFDSDETVTDVLNGGTVTEWAIVPIDFISSDELEQICSSEKAIIRFQNTKKEAKFDHLLAEEEKSSLKHCYQLMNMRSMLSDLHWNYTHDTQ